MSKPQKIIVDGYNVIHADNELKRLAASNLDKSRSNLLSRLREYVKDKAINITVVFDGRGGFTDAESILPAKLQVLFSRFDQSADEVIIEALKGSSNPREYIVVTSDEMDIGRRASSMGAQVISSNEFINRMDSKVVDEPVRKEEKPQPSKDDTAYWLNKFSNENRKENS